MRYDLVSIEMMIFVPRDRLITNLNCTDTAPTNWTVVDYVSLLFVCFSFLLSTIMVLRSWNLVVVGKDKKPKWQQRLPNLAVSDFN
jgi:hypothetical protein